MAGVKPLFTTLRSLVCSGGSMFTIIRRCWSRMSSMPGMVSDDASHDE